MEVYFAFRAVMGFVQGLVSGNYWMVGASVIAFAIIVSVIVIKIKH